MTNETEKEFMATTTIAGKRFAQYDRKSPLLAYNKLLQLLKQEKARVSTRTFFIVKEIDYDPSHKIISCSLFGGYIISGTKPEVEAMLSKAA